MQHLLLFLVTVLLVIVSAWSLGTFIKLGNAFKKYDSDKVFNSACNLSIEYIKASVIISFLILVLSFIILILLSTKLYKEY